jgi:hypothetical protein
VLEVGKAPQLQQQRDISQEGQQVQGFPGSRAGGWAPGGGAGQVLATAQHILLEGGRLVELSGPVAAASTVKQQGGPTEEDTEEEEEEEDDDVVGFSWDARETSCRLRGSPPKHPPLDDLELKLR